MMKKKKRISERLPIWAFIMLMMAIYSGISMLIHLFTVFMIQTGNLNLIGWSPFPVSILMGFLVFAGQAMLLKYHLGISSRNWFIASVLGWTVHLGMTMLFNFYPPISPWLIFSGMTLGLTSLGFAQFIVLRRYVRYAWLWILALPISAVIANFMGSFFRVEDFQSPSLAIHQIVISSTVGFLLAITMTVIVRLTWRAGRQNLINSQDDETTSNHTARLLDNQISHDGLEALDSAPIADYLK